jgi:hypothetical protein
MPPVRFKHLWPRVVLTILGVFVLFGINSGVWHWILGGLLLTLIVPDAVAWLLRRRHLHRGVAPY